MPGWMSLTVVATATLSPYAKVVLRSVEQWGERELASPLDEPSTAVEVRAQGDEGSRYSTTLSA